MPLGAEWGPMAVAKWLRSGTEVTAFVLSLEECWNQSKVGAGPREEDWRSGIPGQWQDRTLRLGSSQEASRIGSSGHRLCTLVTRVKSCSGHLETIYYSVPTVVSLS